MKPPLLFLGAAAVLTATAVLPACKSGGMLARVTSHITKGEGGKVYVVATEKTAFYRHGPQQGNGPDGELPKDTLVSLIRNSFGFSKVQVPSTGQTGFVASEDIMPASQTLLASLSAPTPDPIVAAVNPPPVTPENFDVRSTDPSLVPPPETLPPPDLPPPVDAPAPQ